MNQTISTNIYKNWIYSFSKNDFIKELLFTILFVSQVLFVFPKVLQYCEGMEGAIISDWVLNSLEPRDFSQVIFLVEYSAVFLACLYLLRVPLQFVRGLQAYALLLILRMTTIYLVPLEPPGGMIYLQDTISSSLLDREDLKITKDLFFSGHVSALCLLYYLVQNKKLKYYIFIAAVVVGTLLIWQRVHYTIDVLFAPIGAWITHQTIIYFHKVRVNLVNRRMA